MLIFVRIQADILAILLLLLPAAALMGTPKFIVVKRAGLLPRYFLRIESQKARN